MTTTLMPTTLAVYAPAGEGSPNEPPIFEGSLAEVHKWVVPGTYPGVLTNAETGRAWSGSVVVVTPTFAHFVPEDDAPTLCENCGDPFEPTTVAHKHDDCPNVECPDCHTDCLFCGRTVNTV